VIHIILPLKNIQTEFVFLKSNKIYIAHSEGKGKAVPLHTMEVQGGEEI
jgi:hypothetical protein